MTRRGSFASCAVNDRVIYSNLLIFCNYSSLGIILPSILCPARENCWWAESTYVSLHSWPARQTFFVRTNNEGMIVLGERDIKADGRVMARCIIIIIKEQTDQIMGIPFCFILLGNFRRAFHSRGQVYYIGELGLWSPGTLKWSSYLFRKAVQLFNSLYFMDWGNFTIHQ